MADMILHLLLACGSPNITTDNSPSPTVTVSKEQRYRDGRQSAESNFEKGLVQHLKFGEDMPDDAVHRPSGLPLGTMGCEWDENEAEFARGYNERTSELVKTLEPFPKTMTITWMHHGTVSHRRRATPGKKPLKVTEVTHNAVLVDGHLVESTLQERLEVGILTQKLLNSPGATLTDSYSHSLTVTDSDEQTRIIWKQGAKTVPDELRQAIEALGS